MPRAATSAFELASDETATRFAKRAASVRTEDFVLDADLARVAGRLAMINGNVGRSSEAVQVIDRALEAGIDDDRLIELRSELASSCVLLRGAT